MIDTRRKNDTNFLDQCRAVADFTAISGVWSSTGDKKLHHLQLQSESKIIYTTRRTAEDTIYPSKLSTKVTISTAQSDASNSSSKSESKTNDCDNQSDDSNAAGPSNTIKKERKNLPLIQQ